MLAAEDTAVVEVGVEVEVEGHEDIILVLDLVLAPALEAILVHIPVLLTLVHIPVLLTLVHQGMHYYQSCNNFIVFGQLDDKISQNIAGLEVVQDIKKGKC